MHNRTRIGRLRPAAAASEVLGPDPHAHQGSAEQRMASLSASAVVLSLATYWGIQVQYTVGRPGHFERANKLAKVFFTWALRGFGRVETDRKSFNRKAVVRGMAVSALYLQI